MADERYLKIDVVHEQLGKQQIEANLQPNGKVELYFYTVGTSDRRTCVFDADAYIAGLTKLVDETKRAAGV